MSRLNLPEGISELSFRRTIPNNGRWGQQQQASFGAKTLHGIGGPASFDEWLYRQGIGSGKVKEVFPRRGLLEGGGLDGEPAPGLVVAYWSYDYRDHAMGRLTMGLLCSHQARREKKTPLLPLGTLADRFLLDGSV